MYFYEFKYAHKINKFKKKNIDINWICKSSLIK